mgnify:FL=1
MTNANSSYGQPGQLLTLSADLSRAETVETAVARAIELVQEVFDQPAVPPSM